MKKNVFHFCLFCLIVVIPFTSSAKQANTTTSEAPSTLTVKTSNGVVVLEAISDRIIRVRVQKSLPLRKKPELAIIKQDSYEKAQVEGHTLSTPALKVSVSPNGSISFADASGHILLREGIRKLEKDTVLEQPVWNIAQQYRFKEEEKIYGLGQHQKGVLNYRGEEVLLTQDNTRAVVPFFVSSKGYGILWNNYSQTEFRDSKGQGTLWSEVGPGIDYFFVAGQNTDQIIAGYRQLTGQAPMFGKWAYGFWVCKEHYHTQDEVLDVARELRQRNIPFDNIVQDWYYWSPHPRGSHIFNSRRYPDPAGMVDQLHENYNAHVMLSVWSNFGEGSDNYEEFITQDHLFPTNYFDPYSETGRNIYWKQIRDSLYTKGFDAWWLDATEPELDQTPMTQPQTKQKMNNALGTGARFLNTYSLMTSKAVYEGQRQVSDDQRVFILTRSAFAGQQRYASATWSGDIYGQWDVFKKQIVAGINFSLSGIPYWTTDIGGFTLDKYPGGNLNNEYRELYTRWFQFGAFSPLFRIHGSQTEREPWRFGDEGHWAYDIQMKYLDLRYRLMPYIYSQAWQVTRNHSTFMRGLVFDFDHDPQALKIDDQYMFGPEIMVCPVSEPFYFKDWFGTPAFDVLTSTQSPTSGVSASHIQASYYTTDEDPSMLKTTTHEKLNARPFELFAGDDEKPDALLGRWTTSVEVSEDGVYQLMSQTGNKPWGIRRIRLWVDNQMLIGQSTNMFNQQHKIAEVNLKAGKKHEIRLEYLCYAWEEPTISLSIRKMPGEPSASLPSPLNTPQREIYFPEGNEWIDFWSGQRLAGGTTIHRQAPMGTLPLYVKAGAILPFGPKIQYTTEKKADTIRLRIYPGADGSFLLYEDENDTYGYEDGAYSVIPLKWDEQEKTLTIGKRRGTFPGMLKKRHFSLVLVNQKKGTGLIFGQADRIIEYEGSETTVSWTDTDALQE